MPSHISFNSFVGNSRAVDVLKRAIAQDRLPHAMIFAGPEGVGKCTLALLTAQALNCLSPKDGDACGRCLPCQRIMGIIESRHKSCENGESFCGVCPVCVARGKSHPDIHLIEPEKKTVIEIERVRSLISEVAFQPLEARYRVMILDPAERMKIEAHNALLKTLEEPPSRTIIILVTTNPYSLLETIRSRARILNFGEIPREEIIRYMTQMAGQSTADAQLAAAFSNGSLAVAMDFDTTEYRDVREQAWQFVKMLLGRGNFTDASALVAKVAKKSAGDEASGKTTKSAKKDKGGFPAWLESVSALLQDVYYSGLDDGRIGNRELFEEIRMLRRKTRQSRLIQAIEGLRKLKNDLQYNVNKQIALEALFIKLIR